MSSTAASTEPHPAREHRNQQACPPVPATRLLESRSPKLPGPRPYLLGDKRSSRLQLSHARPLEGRQTLWLAISFCPNHAAAVQEGSEGLETVTFKSCHLVAWVRLSGTAATSLAEGPSASCCSQPQPRGQTPRPCHTSGQTLAVQRPKTSAQGSGKAHRIKRLPQKSKSPPIHLFEEMGSSIKRGGLDIGLRDPCVFTQCTGDRTLTLGVSVTDKRMRGIVLAVT